MPDADVPHPPPLPRCPGCDRLVWCQGHSEDCQLKQEQTRHFSNVNAVRDALSRAIDARRQDRPFMERLAARMAADQGILDRLAEEPAPHIGGSGS